MSKTDRLTEREGGMEGERGRQTDRQINRERGKDGGREMEGEVDRLTEKVGGWEGERGGGRETDSRTKRNRGEKMGRERDRLTNREEWREIRRRKIHRLTEREGGRHRMHLHTEDDVTADFLLLLRLLWWCCLCHVGVG